jgi:hypothetical protein
MPLLLLPLAAAVLGFGTGFVVSDGVGKLLKVAALGGAVYLVYTKTGVK